MAVLLAKLAVFNDSSGEEGEEGQALMKTPARVLGVLTVWLQFIHSLPHSLAT